MIWVSSYEKFPWYTLRLIFFNQWRCRVFFEGVGRRLPVFLVTLDVPPMVRAKVQKKLGYENLIQKGCLLKTCQVEVKMSFLVNIANFPWVDLEIKN